VYYFKEETLPYEVNGTQTVRNQLKPGVGDMDH